MIGSYKFKILCFGLKIASSYFQAFIYMLVDKIQSGGICLYQDDFTFGYNSFEEALKK